MAGSYATNSSRRMDCPQLNFYAGPLKSGMIEQPSGLAQQSGGIYNQGWKGRRCRATGDKMESCLKDKTACQTNM